MPKLRGAKPLAFGVSPPPKKNPLKVPDGAVQRSLVRPARAAAMDATPFDPFKIDWSKMHPPGVGPSDADKKLAFDDALSLAAPAIAWAGNVYSGAFSEGVTFLGYPYLAELTQRPEYRVISEVIATEMTRKWIGLRAKGDDNKDDKISELMDFLKYVDAQGSFYRLAEQDGFFGRSHLYFDTGDGDNPDELKMPIGNGWDDVSKAKVSPEKPIKRLSTVEAVWCYPTNYNSNDPLSPEWYNPQIWFSMAKQIHATRLLRFVGREVPDLLKPAYSFGGLSLSQIAKPYVDNWLRTRQSVSDLIHAFSVFVLGTNLSTSLMADGAELFKRIQLFTNLRDNRGLMITDKDSESLENVSAPLGTLDALQAQSQEHMAAVTRTPLVKLLGITPTGLNASSEGELRTFYDTIHSYQEKVFRRPLHTTIGFAMLSLWGEVDEDIESFFEPLWSLDEKGEAEVRKIEAETGEVHINSGVIRPEEERKRVASDPGTLYPGLKPADVPDLKEEEEAGLAIKGAGGAEKAILEEENEPQREAAE